ncbi:unnamed protein product [Rotaria sordida]|uniref:Uncharacterized protein n=1 Tax=Rotaria sordida TaxID=392033 RepID=A0A819JEC1_9BILA|nr:unnamed protein product [Rotaria sordida]
MYMKQVESLVLIQGASLECNNDDEQEFNFTKALNKWLLAKANLTQSDDQQLINPLIQLFQVLLISNPMLLANKGYTHYTTKSRCAHYFLLYSIYRLSLDENIVKQFALDKRDPKKESVVFSIEIDADRMERPFADISRWSDFKNERGVLFSIGTVFRIDDVADQKISDGIWMVRLSTVSEKDKQLQKEIQQIRLTLLKFFENVLHAQRDVKDDRKIPASNANVAKSSDPLTKATYISNVAKAHLALKHYDKALEFYKEPLDIRRHKCEPNDPSLIHTLHTIGHIYRGKEN